MIATIGFHGQSPISVSRPYTVHVPCHLLQSARLLIPACRMKHLPYLLSSQRPRPPAALRNEFRPMLCTCIVKVPCHIVHKDISFFPPRIMNHLKYHVNQKRPIHPTALRNEVRPMPCTCCIVKVPWPIVHAARSFLPPFSMKHQQYLTRPRQPAALCHEVTPMLCACSVVKLPCQICIQPDYPPLCAG